MFQGSKRARSGAFLMSSAVLAAAAFPHAATAGTVSCNIPQACELYANANGYGVEGTSGKAAGVYGLSHTEYGVLGEAYGTSGRYAGIEGVDRSTNGGINDGVLGTVTNGGWGVEGASSSGAFGGMKGSATAGVGVEGTSSSYIGVYGSSSSSYGIEGYSPSASGVLGSSSSGFGVYGSSSSNDAGHFQSSGSGTAVAAISGTGDALYAVTGGGIGAYIHNSNGNGTDVTGSYIGLLGRSGSYPLVLTDTSGNNLAWVDGSGNMYVKGTFNTFAPVRSGGFATAYASRTTTPNVEDVGSAQLTNGVANVRLDPAFAASIDAQSAYHVFLTPNGDTRGLFVASKTPAGFVVRETQGGHATLAFDYRIVAAALGHANERMALVRSGSAMMPSAKFTARAAAHAPAIDDVSRHFAAKQAPLQLH